MEAAMVVVELVVVARGRGRVVVARAEAVTEGAVAAREAAGSSQAGR